MDKSKNDGIYALASGEGRTAVSVVRISGHNAINLIKKICRQKQGDYISFPPRKMMLRSIFDVETKKKIDEALVVYFPKGKSYTGEEMAEIHLHGGTAVYQALLECLAKCEGWRPALPGEFTKRAFLEGKIDLNEAEAILDLVNAETEEQRKQAIFQISESRGRGFREWADNLSIILAHVQAALDFPDESETSFDNQARNVCLRIMHEMSDHLEKSEAAERLNKGITIVIAGETNVGKSTFINRLSGRDVAIVTEYEGTTRDPVEVKLEWSGLPVTAIDTAGFREKPDEIETLGIDRTLILLEKANLVVWIRDASKRMKGKSWQRLIPKGIPTVVLYNKIDLLGSDKFRREGAYMTYDVSLRTGENWAVAKEELGKILKELVAGGEQALLVRERHRIAIKKSRDSIKKALEEEDEVLIAENLKSALRQLGTVTGEVVTEDILDIIFRDFCIGK